MRTLITGAAGFIGHHLANHLVGRSHEVVGVDSCASGSWDRVSDRVARINSPIEDLSEKQWLQLLDGVDFVFHLAAKKYNTPQVTASELLSVNVAATRTICHAAGLLGVKRLIFASSLYAYGSSGPDDMSEKQVVAPTTLYGASKLMGENLCKIAEHEVGLSWNAARLFFIYGPGQYADGGYKSVIVSNFERMRDGLAPTVCGDGLQELDYVYIDDAISALCCMAESQIDSVVANVATGTGVSVRELTQLMSSASSTRSSPRFQDPDWTAGSRRVGRTDLIEGTFGWRARVNLESGLQATWRALSSGEGL